MNTIANFSIWFGQASELKVDTPDRSQPLQRMATRISLISGALGFTILGTLIIMNRLQADLDCLSGGSAIAIPAGTAFLLGACLHWKGRARLPAALPAGHRLARFTFSRCKSAIDLTWILAAATMLCTFLSPLECRGGVGPVVLQDFADWEKQHRGSWIQVTDYDSAAKCFRMTPAVYNEEFAAMAIGYVDSAPNILMWLVFTPSGSFLYRSDQGVIPLVNPEPFPAKASPQPVEPRKEPDPKNAVAPEIFTRKPPLTPHLNELDSNDSKTPGGKR
jgi:hypothetical protein